MQGIQYSVHLNNSWTKSLIYGEVNQQKIFSQLHAVVGAIIQKCLASLLFGKVCQYPATGSSKKDFWGCQWYWVGVDLGFGIDMGLIWLSVILGIMGRLMSLEHIRFFFDDIEGTTNPDCNYSLHPKDMRKGRYGYQIQIGWKENAPIVWWGKIWVNPLTVSCRCFFS